MNSYFQVEKPFTLQFGQPSLPTLPQTMESILILQLFRCEKKQTSISMLDILYCLENINSTIPCNLIVLPVSTNL
ncbi:hypothetical protein L873DRAFT_1071164 [Choiromyces venosus 120613-1]|uniref:Uncharacterized protein n=1 Tax=Choiromyces venosus 120613-1 TaxID=1336337 RepID=A0A3N4K3R1_9PEZI|nr:hypothetical protein L873DRAFT_1071164 [Choiromyces venosus 120613-1]